MKKPNQVKLMTPTEKLFTLDDVMRAMEPSITKKIDAEMMLVEIYETCTCDEVITKLHKFLVERELI